MDRETLAADTAKTAAALRSQLNQMAAASQVLERSTAGEKERTYLAVINQSICRMLRIVGRMELGHRLTDREKQQNQKKGTDHSGGYPVIVSIVTFPIILLSNFLINHDQRKSHLTTGKQREAYETN